MTLLQYWVFSFWTSLITHNVRILSILFLLILFCYLFSTPMFFLHCIIKILSKMKKILSELMNRLLYNTSADKIENGTGNIKSIFLFDEIDDTSSLIIQYQDVYSLCCGIFWKWYVNQRPFPTNCPFFFLRVFYLSTSSLFNFNLSTLPLLINFIITYHTWFHSLSSLESSDIILCPSF